MGDNVESPCQCARGDAIALSVKDNYREAVIEQFPIEAFKSDSSAVLIKVNKVFDGSEKSFNDLYNSISLGASVKKNCPDRGMKAFPQNIVVKSFSDNPDYGRYRVGTL